MDSNIENNTNTNKKSIIENERNDPAYVELTAYVAAKKEKWRNTTRHILGRLAIALQSTDIPTEFLISKEYYIYPSADVIFSYLNSDKVVFAALMSSTMNEVIETKDLEVKSQVTLAAAPDFNEKYIRLDLMGINKVWIMVAEMQNDYRLALTDHRSPYYHAVAMASQIVEGMQYDKLKTVCVTFIMPTKKLKDSSGIRHLEWADVATKEFIENSDRRYFLYLPNILQNEKIKAENPMLYMFARFYSILDQKQADAFLQDYKDDCIARRLIHMHNVLYEEKTNVQEMNTIPYYDRRILEHRALRAENEAVIAKNEAAIAKNEAEKAKSKLAEKDEALAEKDEALAEKDAQIAKLLMQLKKSKLN